MVGLCFFKPSYGLKGALLRGRVRFVKTVLKILTVALVLTVVSALAYGQDQPTNSSPKAQQKQETDKKAQPLPSVTPSQKPAFKKRPSEQTLIVFDIIAERGVDKGLANILTEVVINKTTKLKKFKVLGQKDLDKMLSWEQSKQLQGCTDTGCLVQLAGALGASYYFEGSIGTVGNSYMVTLKLIDALAVNVIARDTINVEKDENKIVKAVELLVDTILERTIEQITPAVSDLSKVKPEQEPGFSSASYVAMTKWGVGLTFSGVAVAGLGGVFTYLASSAADDYHRGVSPQEMESADSKRQTYNGLAIAGYSVGGAMLATGVVLWIVGATDNKTKSKVALSGLTLTPVFTPDTAMISVGGGW